MNRTYLVATFITDKNDKRPVIELDIVVNQVRDAGI